VAAGPPLYYAPMNGLDGTATIPPPESDSDDGEMVEEDLVIEEISIDGMCGVY
jgi:mycofactocin precursor